MGLFDETGKVGRADGGHRVVEVESRVMAERANALTKEGIAARTFVKEIGKILGPHVGRAVGDSRRFAHDPARNAGGEFGLGGIVDRRRVIHAIIEVGGAAESGG